MNARRKLKRHMAAVPCKKRPSAASSWETGATTLVKATASDKIPNIKFNCIVEGHESTRPRVESVTKKIHEGQFAGKRAKFFVALQLGAHIHSDAACDENSGCKGSNGQRMQKARDDSSVAV